VQMQTRRAFVIRYRADEYIFKNEGPLADL